MEMMYQVNCHTDVDGREEYYISRAYNGGYVGRETDTVYSDGVSYTDYGVYFGTEEECQEYIKKVEVVDK